MLSFTEMENVCKNQKLLPRLLGMEEKHGLVKIVHVFDRMIVCFEDGTSFPTKAQSISFSDYSQVLYDAIGEDVLSSYSEVYLTKVSKIAPECITEACVGPRGYVSIRFNNRRLERQLDLRCKVDTTYKFLVIKDGKNQQLRNPTYFTYYEDSKDLKKYIVDAVNLFLESNPNIKVMEYTPSIKHLC